MQNHLFEASGLGLKSLVAAIDKLAVSNSGGFEGIMKVSSNVGTYGSTYGTSIYFMPLSLLPKVKKILQNPKVLGLSKVSVEATYDDVWDPFPDWKKYEEKYGPGAFEIFIGVRASSADSGNDPVQLDEAINAVRSQLRLEEK